MSTERFTMRVAVYLILLRGDQVVLLRRFQTGWHDGDYTLPAGHLDGNESVRVAACREALEETGVIIAPDDLEFAHVAHRYAPDSEYVDFYFATTKWQGEPTNMEPQKCDELRWAPLDSLPENILSYIAPILASYAAGGRFTEVDWQRKG